MDMNKIASLFYILFAFSNMLMFFGATQKPKSLGNAARIFTLLVNAGVLILLSAKIWSL